MRNDSKKHRIGIVDFALIDAGLSHCEALVYSYVQRFERNRKPCFASIPHIAKELRFSESATKRYIRRLIAEKYLQETTKGRGRYLTTTGVNLASNGVKLACNRGQIDLNDRGQIEPLPLKVLPIETTNINLPIKNILRNQKAGRGSLKKEFFISDQETEAEKAAYLAFKRSLLGK